MSKKASDKQKYVCAWIYNYKNHDGSILWLRDDSQKFAESLSAKEAWNYIQENEDTYKTLKNIWWNKKKKIMLEQSKARLERLSVYDNAFEVTDWSDCYDYGIYPWGDS